MKGTATDEDGLLRAAVGILRARGHTDDDRHITRMEMALADHAQNPGACDPATCGAVGLARSVLGACAA